MVSVTIADLLASQPNCCWCGLPVTAACYGENWRRKTIFFSSFIHVPPVGPKHTLCVLYMISSVFVRWSHSIHTKTTSVWYTYLLAEEKMPEFFSPISPFSLSPSSSHSLSDWQEAKRLSPVCLWVEIGESLYMHFITTLDGAHISSVHMEQAAGFFIATTFFFKKIPVCLARAMAENHIIMLYAGNLSVLTKIHCAFNTFSSTQK